MRSSKIVFPALVVGMLFGCVDGPIASRYTGETRLALAPQFSLAGPAAGLPIEFVRVIPRFAETNAPAGETLLHDVSPTDEGFAVFAVVDLGDRESASIIVEVELLSVGSGDLIVEWSALVGPIHVEASQQPSPYTEQVTLVRGPIGNLTVEALYAYGPENMHRNTSADAWAEVASAGDHLVLWTSSDERVATVDPVGDTVQVHAIDAGSAWIHAAAGMHADSFMVVVDSSATAGGAASVLVVPDSATVVVGATRAWQALVLDSLGFPVSVPVAWESLDPNVASVTSDGVVGGVSVGRARVVASVDGLADTAIAVVEALPEGVDLLWLGGTPGAESDWHTADNWSPARVPGPDDVVYIPGVQTSLTIDGNVEVGGFIADTLGGPPVGLAQGTTLTVHGDLIAFVIIGDSTTRVVMDGDGVLARGYVPPLVVRGDVTIPLAVYASGSVTIEAGATLRVAPQAIVDALDDVNVNGGNLVMSYDSVAQIGSVVYANDDIVFDGGDSGSSLAGGFILVGGDFTVTDASCTAFRPTGVEVEMLGDTVAISIGCPGAEGNRFWNLSIFGPNQPVHGIELLSHITVLNEFLIVDNPVSPTYVTGNGFTIVSAFTQIASSTFDQAFLEVTGPLYTDSLAFRGMAGEQRPQLVADIAGTGCPTCYQTQYIVFDSSSAGPYIALNDPIADGDSATWYIAHNPGDGPERTVTSGEAVVHWADIPARLQYISGDGQTGPAGQPLTDSLVVQVTDYGSRPVAGVTVTWTVMSGDGLTEPATTVSDANGLAATLFTMGSVDFPTQTVTASAAGVAQTVTFLAFPDPEGSPGNAPARLPRIRTGDDR